MDTTRLARAVHLTVQRLEPGRYLVTGGSAPHHVTAAGGALVCDCTDAAIGHECKHVLCVRLWRGDPDAIMALRALVAMPKRSRRKAEAA